MIDFGRLLKRFRTSNSLSQNELVDLVTSKDNKLVGLDVVTISRWENWMVVPTHRRQIEVFQGAHKCFFDVVLANEDLLIHKFRTRIIEKSNVWENTENVQLENVVYKEIKSKDEKGNTLYCILYTDRKGIPLGQITYKYLSENDFWHALDKENNSSVNDKSSEKCLQISSMFCLSNKILPHMLGMVTRQLLLKKINMIGFSSKNKKSNLKRFLRAVGFKIHKEQQDRTSLVLTYYDALYNKELFYCSILVGFQGELNVKKV